MAKEVYINRISKFLPNQPINNDDMEKYLGMIDGKPSKAKGIIMRNNQIKSRYYALDEQGIISHCEAKLSRYKLPRKVIFVDTIPRNPSGKILKRVLRVQYA